MTNETPKMVLLRVAAELGLTMTAEFIPCSRSRNVGQKDPTLNWQITLKRNGRDVLTTVYSAGMGHCPAYDDPSLGQGMTTDRRGAINLECETGRTHRGRMVHNAHTQILPEIDAVLYSLARDSDVLDAGGFEEWARDLGYDTDSRKAESIYRACIDVALKLRVALGDDGLAKLRAACQDY